MATWERWIHGDLTPQHFDWLRALPKTLTRGDLLLCHGTPRNDAENWLDERGPDHRMHMASAADIAARCYGARAPVILCAHTHVPRIVRLQDGRLIVNPGSVGVPAYLDIRPDPPFEMETGAPDARFGILEKAGSAWQASLHMAAYDPRRMIALAESRGTGIWTAPLATGFARGFAG
ncbi:MAG: metallophosphatase family protein [Alphaproteobacteria bacterium]|nr:metallophosphatase family protein [Alphaproteobacteria bacterium]NNF23563.1 hypothetical protein [Paracoccaceae bacterium]